MVEQKEYKIKELIKLKERTGGINGQFVITHMGIPYNNNNNLWSRKYTLCDSIKSQKLSLTLTLFDNKNNEKWETGILEKFEVGDKIRIKSAMYDPREGTNKLGEKQIYHNISIGKYGIIQKI